MNGKLAARIHAWKLFGAGKITFIQALWMMLPSSMRPEELTYYNFGIWVLDQYRLKLLTKKNAHIIDAGANRGVFAILAAKTHPDATIYAFEPTPAIFQLLVKETEKYPNIKCYNFALGNENRMTSIIDNGGEGGCNTIEGSHTVFFDGKGEKKFPIEMKTIDSLNLQMDFLKIDTEGSEGIILEGAKRTIERYKPIISMSAYHHPEDKEELPRILNGITPYNIQMVVEDEEDFICTPV